MTSTTKSRRLEFVLGVVFFIVGVVSAVNTLQLNNYIIQTIPRDTAQESCQLETLAALRTWATARGMIEDAKEDRDAALAPMFRQLERGEKVDPKTAEAAESAFNRVNSVREDVAKILDVASIPKCQLGPGENNG